MFNRKGFSKAVVVVAVVVLIGAGYFIYNNSKKDKDASLSEQTDASQSSVKTEEQQILTAEEMPEELTYEENLKLQGWKTYKNEEYGFEVMYPGYYTEPRVFTRKEPYLLGMEIVKKIKTPIAPNIDGLMEVVIEVGVFGRGYFDFLDYSGTKTIWNAGEDLEVGNNIIRKILDRDKFNQETLYYVFRKNDYSVAFRFNKGVDENVEKYVIDKIPEFNQILFTFKFTK